MTLKVGILAVQGDVEEHEGAVEAAGEELGVEVDTVWVRYPEDVEGLDALIVPGGESTTIGRIMERHDLVDPVVEEIESGLPVMGTCAGLVLLAKEVVPQAHPGREVEIEQPCLGVLDVRVVRNAFGRQRESFEVDLEVEGMDEPFTAVFIRAPGVEKVLSDDVDVLAEFGDYIVAVEQGNVLATAFHPELADDPRFHVKLLEKAL
ncbi:MAG: pyridoxal 5'-phosphate synthase glutaminase subunit PdxT [Methanopyri archaeon]|nr:pyridoxal 5'-phosphate synthase glutaminase subunit PdxT [Methanopyri archaeon]